MKQNPNRAYESLMIIMRLIGPQLVLTKKHLLVPGLVSIKGSDGF